MKKIFCCPTCFSNAFYTNDKYDIKYVYKKTCRLYDKYIDYQIINDNLYCLFYQNHNLSLIKIDFKTYNHEFLINITNYILILDTGILNKNGIYIIDNDNNINYISLLENNYGIVEIIENKEHKIIKILKSENEIHYLCKSIDNFYYIIDEKFNIIFNIITNNNIENPNFYIENDNLYIHDKIINIDIRYYNDIFIISYDNMIITCNKHEILSYNNYNCMRFISHNQIIFTDYDIYLVYNLIDKTSYILPECLWNYDNMFLINNKYILSNHMCDEKLLKVNLNDKHPYIYIITMKYNDLNINESLELINKIICELPEKYKFMEYYNDVLNLIFDLLFSKYNFYDVMYKINEIYKPESKIYNEIIFFALTIFKHF